MTEKNVVENFERKFSQILIMGNQRKKGFGAKRTTPFQTTTLSYRINQYKYNLIITLTFL